MTMKWRATLAVFLFIPAVAAAQVSLGIRAGYAIPSGDLQKDSKLSDQLKSMIPVQIDAMVRVTPRTSVGLYGTWGFDQVATALKDNSALLVGPGASYRATSYRVGLQATHALMDGPIVPWVGLGSGIEIGTFKVENGPATIKGNTRGWEWVNLQVGGDYTVSPKFVAGLYAQWAIGQFTYQWGEVSGTGSIFDGSAGGGLGSDASTHSWFSFGLRGRFDL
jgi:hypothetical protein